MSDFEVIADYEELRKLAKADGHDLLPWEELSEEQKQNLREEFIRFQLELDGWRYFK